MVHIPFKGTAEAATDVSGGRGHAVTMPTAGIGPYLQDTRRRAIGITSARRSPLLPQLPTLAEAGLPPYVFESWFGLLAPKGPPPATVDKINAAVNKVIVEPEVADRLHKLGIETGFLNAAGFNKLFLTDRDLMYRIVKESGITRE